MVAADEDTGEVAAREVVTTIEGMGERVLVEVGVDSDGDGRTDAEVTATDRHPIWAADPAAPPTAMDLAAGVELGVVGSSAVVADPAASVDGSGSGGGGPPTARTLDPGTTHGAPVPSGYDGYDTESGAAAGDLPGRWVDAIDLTTGQLLHTSHGTWTRATSIDVRIAHTTVHNLTVADLHTYHVFAGDEPVLVHNCGGESYYRTMSEADFETLSSIGRLPSTGETMISPTHAFSEPYEGALVELTVKPGMTSKLARVGVRDRLPHTAAVHSERPIVGPGWAKTSAHFKYEKSKMVPSLRGQINIGLGRGPALDLFDNSRTGFKRLR